jgi:RNA polymerase sigma-70 factor (ECF subfamily)
LATTSENIDRVIDSLFRKEAGKLISVLTKVLGPGNIEVAEDVVQDAIIEAIHQWEYKGVPDNPTGWIYNVAKFKALNILKRENVEQKHSSLLFENQSTLNEVAIDQLFSEKEIEDDQLRMMFTCCHPDISSDSQIALILKTLCGFSIPEISKAFLTNEENINKRLVRARKTIRENKIEVGVPSQNEIANRLNTILVSS